MAGKEIKEKLIAERHNVNYIYYDKVMNNEPQHDSIGLDFEHFTLALKWVPNHVLRKWIRETKKEIKKHEKREEAQDDNT